VHKIYISTHPNCFVILWSLLNLFTSLFTWTKPLWAGIFLYQRRNSKKKSIKHSCLVKSVTCSC
jgi:hypothetical protein